MKYIYIIIIILIFYIFNNLKSKKYESNKNIKNKSNICRGYLTDLEYLEHMIPHHQVAIDISKKFIKINKNPFLHDILRKLIWTQTYEIEMMNRIKKKLPKNVSAKSKNKKYQPLLSDYQKPNELGLTKTYCDPHFFDPDMHLKHMHHMKLNFKSYIEHMIPHHQVAVDMSKVLLKNTDNDFMIYLAYRIIRTQQSEILFLNDILKKSKYFFESDLIL